jgi:hypothetical protein
MVLNATINERERQSLRSNVAVKSDLGALSHWT